MYFISNTEGKKGREMGGQSAHPDIVSIQINSFPRVVLKKNLLWWGGGVKGKDPLFLPSFWCVNPVGPSMNWGEIFFSVALSKLSAIVNCYVFLTETIIDGPHGGVDTKKETLLYLPSLLFSPKDVFLCLSGFFFPESFHFHNFLLKDATMVNFSSSLSLF